MNQKLPSIRTVFLLAAAVVLILTTAVIAAPDDEEPEPNPEVAVANFNIDESNFDQWIFQGVGNAKAGRERIKSRLKLQLDEVDRVCGLRDAQKEKLALAARGDIKRFFDQVEEVRKKFLEVRKDQNAFQGIWQDIQPLQQKQAAGLFGELSLYAKTLRKTLDAEQAAQYRTFLDERRQFRYRASIEVAMTTLESSVALRNEQREALIQALLEKTRAPIVFGGQDYYFVMYRLARIAEKDVKPLLDERQWTLLKIQMDQAGNTRAMLIQNGALAADDFNAADDAAGK